MYANFVPCLQVFLTSEMGDPADGICGARRWMIAPGMAAAFPVSRKKRMLCHVVTTVLRIESTTSVPRTIRAEAIGLRMVWGGGE
jgi:hypothetical protein